MRPKSAVRLAHRRNDLGSLAALVAALPILLSCSGETDADVEVVSVEVLGPMERPASIRGRDGGTSGRFQGRSVWVYGDSVATEMGTFPSTWRNNTMSWTADLDARDGITGFVQPVDALGAAREFFPRTDEEEAFNAAHVDRGDGSCTAPCGARYAIWGSGPIEDPVRNRALLVYGKIYSEPGEFNFSVLGMSIAVWESFDAAPVRVEVESDVADPGLLFAASEGEFGIPVVSEDYLYLFACSGGGDDSRRCRLARAPLADVLRRPAWQFRARDGWSSDVARAAALFEGSPNMTVHWNAHVGRWLAVYISWSEIVVRTAEQVDGPWSAPLTVYTAPEDGAIHALAHPEYQEDGGALEYVSYLAGDEFRLLRVRLARR
jgi:hypothetical protein